MIVVYSHSDNFPERQYDTAIAIDLIRAAGYRVVDIDCNDESAYWKGLLQVWRKDTIINIEQDMVPSVHHLDSMAECPADSCTFPYTIKNGEYALFRATTKDDIASRFYKPPFPIYVEGSGIGCVKIGRNLQALVDLDRYPVDRYHWFWIDSWIASQMKPKGLKWHVHSGRVRHNRPAD